jgi:hypothetical protein
MKRIKTAIFAAAMLCCTFLAADFNVNTSQNPTNGDTVTAWDTYTLLGYDIMVSTQIGGTWNPAVPIANPLSNPTQPVTAINSSGQMAVIWQGFDTLSFNQALYGSFFNGFIWVTSQLSDPIDEYVIGNYQVKVADNGTVVATWSSYIYSSNSNEARGNYSSVYGTWGSPMNIP